MRGVERRVAWAVGAIALAALALRLAVLDAQGVWVDEGYTALLLRDSFGGMLRALPEQESTPPLFYVLDWLATRVAGTGEVGMRLLPAVASAAAVPLCAAAAHRLAGGRAAIAAAALMAASPLAVWFGQEARAYALVLPLAAAALWCFAALHDEQRPATRWWVGWTAASVALVATHWFTAFLVAAQLAWLVVRPGPQDRRVRGAAAALAAAAVALAPLLLAQRDTGNAEWIASEGFVRRLVQVPKQLLTGYASPGQVATTIAAALIVVAAAWWLSRAREHHPALPAAAVAGLAAVLVPVVLALTGTDYLLTRNVLVVLPTLVVLIAAGLAAAPRRAGAPLATTLAVLLLGITVAAQATEGYGREDWRGAARWMGDSPVDGRAIVTPGAGTVALRFYFRQASPLPTPGATVREIAWVAVADGADGGTRDAPRLAQPPPLPAGFAVVRERRTATWAAVVARATVPTPVAPAQLSGAAFGGGEATAVVSPGA